MSAHRLAGQLVIAAVLAVGPALAATRPSSAADPGPSLVGNVSEVSDPALFYASAPAAPTAPVTTDLANPRFYMAAGIQDASGAWHYPVTYRGTLGQPAVVRELSADPDSHRELLVTGLVTAEAASSAIHRDAPNAQAQGSTTNLAPATNSSNLSALSSGSASHYVYTRWYDPINLTLTSAYDEADVYWDSHYNITSAYYYYSLYWNTNNAWRLTYNHLAFGLVPPAYGYYTASYATMQTSSWFPLPTCGTTRTYYSPNEVYTYVGGGGDLNIDTWATSGCLALLHWEYYIG
jgi:hypothetical protein